MPSHDYTHQQINYLYVQREIGRRNGYKLWEAVCTYHGCGKIVWVTSLALGQGRQVCDDCRRLRQSETNLEKFLEKDPDILLIRRTDERVRGAVVYVFLCPRCGKQFPNILAEVGRGRVRSCGCLIENHDSSNFVDYADLQIGCLLITKQVGRAATGGYIIWEAVCTDCGKTFEVSSLGLRRGQQCECTVEAARINKAMELFRRI